VVHCVRGELLSLGHRVAASTISRVLRSHGIGPTRRRTSTTWRQFLRRQAGGIVACDFFPVDAVSLRLFYSSSTIGLGGSLLAGTTTNPTRAWVTQCAGNVTEDLRDAGVVVRYLLRDHDGKFGPTFDADGRHDTIEFGAL
jgi:putative transposase